MIPEPTPLHRTTPRMTLRPVGGRRIRGICEECGWTTHPVTTAGMVTSLAGEHGRVLSDESTVPACPSVQEWIPTAGEAA